MISSKKVIIVVFACLQTSVFAGVALVGDIPKSVHTLIVQKQEELGGMVQKINNTTIEKNYKFETFGFSPHMTIAYITKEELSLADVYIKEPQLKEMLLKVTGLCACIDLTENARKSYPEFWQGKFEGTMLDGSRKRIIII